MKKQIYSRSKFKRYCSLTLILFFLTISLLHSEVIYSLDDFDDLKWQNDFYAETFTVEIDDGILYKELDSNTYYGPNGRSLKMTYNIESYDALAGHFERLSFDYQNPNPVYDLSRFEKLRFYLKGAAGNHTTKMLVQFEDDSTNWHKIEISGISDTWKEFTIDLSSLAFDKTKIRHISFLFDYWRVTDKTGVIWLDNISLVDEDEEPATDDQLLNLISRQAFQYFWDTAHPVTGLCRDKASDVITCSIEATGFALSAYCIGAQRGWVSRADAARRVEKVLNTLWTKPQGSGTSGTIGYKGFFYHFVDTRTGLRLPNVELTSIGTALCLSGVLLCQEYFNENNSVESDIRDLADKIYRRVEWNWFLDSNSGPHTNQFYMAWKPEQGYILHWDYFTEEAIAVSMLAIASPTYPVNTDAMYAWDRIQASYGGHEVIQSFFGSLFTYYFAQCWFDFRDKKDQHPLVPVNWWSNSRKAALANRQFCIDNAGSYKTYGPNQWGLSACYDRYDVYRGDNGSLPCGLGTPRNENLVPPAGAGSCIVFFSSDTAVNESMAAIRNYYNNYPELWSIYGFRDSFSLGSTTGTDDDYYTHECLSLNQGSLLLMIENFRSQLVWNTFKNNSYISNAMVKIFSELPGKPAKPVIISINAISTNQINLVWKDLPNETSYTLFRNLSNDTNTAMNINGFTANQTNYTNTGLSPDRTYFYWVKAYNLFGDSGFSIVGSNTTWPVLPVTPEIININATSSSQINLIWNDVPNETSYTLFRNLSNDTNTATKIEGFASDQTNYINTGLDPDTIFFYWIKAYNNYGKSGFSSVASNTTLPLSPDIANILKINTLDTNKIGLIWNDVSRETSYTLFRNLSNDTNTATNIKGLAANQTNYINTGLSPGTTYFYWVKAYNISGGSGYSAVASNRTWPVWPLTPEIIQINATSSSQINLIWNNVPNETSYTLFRNLSNDTNTATNIKGFVANHTNYHNMGLIPEVTYYYWVKAYNNSGESGYSDIASNTTLPLPPGIPKITDIKSLSAFEIELKWDNITNASSYKLFRNTSDEFASAKNIAVISSGPKQYKDTGLNQNTTYYYWLKAVNSGGESDYSEVASVSTLKAFEPDLNKLIAGPSPYKPYDGDSSTGAPETGIIFGRLTKDAVIEVYTIKGELVTRLEETDGDGRHVWQVPDRIASGVYICRITNSQGEEKIIKILIIK